MSSISFCCSNSPSSSMIPKKVGYFDYNRSIYYYSSGCLRSKSILHNRFTPLLGATFSSNPIAHTQAHTPTSPSRTHSFKTPPFYHHHCSRHQGYTPPRTCQSQLTGLVCISHTSFSKKMQHVFHHTNTTEQHRIQRHTKLYFTLQPTSFLRFSAHQLRDTKYQTNNIQLLRSTYTLGIRMHTIFSSRITFTPNRVQRSTSTEKKNAAAAAKKRQRLTKNGGHSRTSHTFTSLVCDTD